ncbi:hypothetical protein BJY01DRAFT_249675 [Aspergillus pseudoustus]|uniref:Uncharacterized protein n=1 Tax=Aspergillus pseudoustus TaxID=1810923 RepID=A0ABR4JMY1_9EURO
MADETPRAEVDTPATSLLPITEQKLELETHELEVGKARVPWTGPALLTVPLICGILFSIGHHLLYSELDGQFIEEGTLDQKWAIRIGSGFAFLAKASFTLSVSSAAVQWLFYTMMQKAATVQAIDNAFAADSNLLALCKWETWKSFKIFGGLMLVVWTIPLSALITPAALTVVIDNRVTSGMHHVPTIDIANRQNASRYAYTFDTVTDVAVSVLGGPSPRMSRIVRATAGTGQIIQASPLAPNMSYSMSFYAPAVRCKPGTTADTATMANLTDLALEKHYTATGSNSSTAARIYNVNTLYFGFSPQLPDHNHPTFNWSTLHDVFSLDVDLAPDDWIVPPTVALESSGGSVYSPPASGDASGPASNALWALVLSDVGYLTHSDADSDTDGPSTPASKYTSLKCQLYNSSVAANITYENGNQVIRETKREILDYVPEPYTWSYSDAAGSSLNSADGLDQSLFAYSGYMQAIVTLIQGIIAHTGFGAWANSGIMDSALIGSRDIVAGLPSLLESSNDEDSSAAMSGFIEESERQSHNRSLLALIEELADNVTYSLLSDQTLSPPKLANVTISTATARYTYDAFALWLAYGLAILFSAVGLVLGNLALFFNKVTYDKSFSSHVRATRNPDLDRLIGPSTWPVQPADRGLSNALLRLRVGSGNLVGRFEAVEGKSDSTVDRQ